MKFISPRKCVALLSLFALLIFASVGCSDDSDSNSNNSSTNNQPQTPDTCGNGELDDGEVCDASILAGETCETQGASGGQLACKSTCLGFDFTGCTAPDGCGDGAIQAPEVCDGEELGEASCASLGFDRGTLSCANNCLDVDSSACSNEGQCEPTTCADVGALCGSVDDGCGATLDCGGCEGDLSCGGGGEPNICGASCPLGCPDGFSCNSVGVCTGESDAIVVNMPTATVTALAQVDGAVPQATSACNNDRNAPLAYITLISDTTGVSQAHPVPCDGTAAEFVVAQDTYSVSVRGHYSSDMPLYDFRTHDALVIDSDTTLNANMPTATVTALAQVDGAAPQATSVCNNDRNAPLAYITLVSDTTGASQPHPVPCDGTAAEFVVPQDTYSVSVRGHYSSDMPLYDFRTHDALVIDSDTILNANMPTATLTALAQVDGAVPQATSVCNNDRGAPLAYITLVSDTTGVSQPHPVPCDGDEVEIVVPQDTYSVSVRGHYSSDMPLYDFRTHDALVIDSDTNLNANMPTATLTALAQVDGAVPQATSACNNDRNAPLAYLTLISDTTGVSQAHPVPCDGTAAEFVVAQDTYSVSVRGHYSSDMPLYDFRTHDALVIDSDTILNANMPTATLTALAQVDGAVPQATSVCNNDRGAPLAYITLVSDTTGVSQPHPVPCDGDEVEIVVPQDTYSVSVRGHYSSDMPLYDFRTHDALVIDSDTTLNANMPTATLTALAQVDGAVPQATSACNNDRNAPLAYLTLISDTTGVSQAHPVPCDGTAAEFVVAQDTYSVSVRGHYSSDMPLYDFRTHDALVIDSDTTLNANMPTATLTALAQVDGAAPQATSVCNNDRGAPLAYITLVSDTTGVSQPHPVPCDGTAAEFVVPQDTYSVSVRGHYSSDMPLYDYLAIQKIELK